MDVSELQSRIDAIDDLIASGRTMVVLGDRTVAYNQSALRQERDRLSRLIASASAASFRRVVFKGGSAF